MTVRAFLVVALLGSVAVAGVTTASPPPERLCGICTSDLSDIGADNGVAFETGESALEIRVFENGSSRWTERVVLEPVDGEQLGGDNERFRAVVRDARETRWLAVSDPESLRVRLNGTTLTASYRVDDVTTEGVGGVVLFDVFHTEPRGSHTMAADEIRLRGPPGTTIVNHVPRADIRGSTALWEQSPRVREDPRADTFVAFASDGGTGATVAAAVSVALTVGPLLIEDAVVVGGPPAAFLLVLGIGTVFARRERKAALDPDDRRVTKTALALAILCLGCFAVAWAFSLPVLGAVGLGAVPLGWTALGSAPRRVDTALALAVVAVTPLAFGLAAAPIGGFGPRFVLLFATGGTLLFAPLYLACYWGGERMATDGPPTTEV